MTIVIQIAHSESPEAVERVRELLDEIARRDVSWNGVEFAIERGDFTCIPGRDDADAVTLFNRITNVLMGEDA